MKKSSCASFAERLRQSSRKDKRIIRVMFELTYRCNFHCAHCYVPRIYRNRPELSTSQVFKVLDQLKAAECFYLGFTGGEPLMRSDAMDILSYACRAGFEVALYTNGSLIDADLARALARLRLNKIDITIPGFSSEVFDRVTASRGSRRKVFRAIELLRARRVPLALKSCILADNEAEIPHIAALAREIGAYYRLDDQLSARLDGSRAPLRCRPRRATAHEAKRQDRARAEDLDLCACGIASTQAAITPRGLLKPCLMLESPRCSILKHGLGPAWAKLRREVARLSRKAAASPLTPSAGMTSPCLAEWQLAAR